HLDGAALLDLHRSLDGVRVIRVVVLLTAAIQTTRARVDALLDGGVRDFLDQHGDLHGVSASSGERTFGMLPLSLTDESIGRGDRTAPGCSARSFPLPGLDALPRRSLDGGPDEVDDVLRRRA